MTLLSESVMLERKSGFRVSAFQLLLYPTG
ncbi:hypothetical protein ACVIRO_005125 [Rhizobium ruizarguesonis]|jgi:hypothetical protein